MNLTVSNWTLFLSAVLVLVSLGISQQQHLGLNKEIIISVIRAIIQLFIVGYILRYVFKINNLVLTLVLLFIIIFNASWNAMKRDRLHANSRSFIKSLTAIFVSTMFTMGVLILSGSIKAIPAQVIPIGGMIAGNSMVAVGLCYRDMYTRFKEEREQLIEKLALGATPFQTVHNLIRESIKTGMQPTIDSARTIGIVSLPGMMSGLIFAGVDPLRAIKYQIMVTFMLLSATSLASIIAVYMSYSDYFNDREQLIEL